MPESSGEKTGAKVRCFVAIDTPAELKERVSALIARMRGMEGGRKVRWVKPDGVHLTLKFLGDVPAEQIAEITAALASGIAEAGSAAFDLSLGGLGSFGKPGAPRVIWVGVGGDKATLNKLQQAVEKALNPLGFVPEERGFNPHLTLGRVPELGREERAALSRLLDRYTNSPEVQFGRFSVSEAVLMESDRRPDGAVYTPIAHFPFA
jgi:2'-5' RNA ligase